MSLEFDCMIRNIWLLFSLDLVRIKGLYIYTLCALHLVNSSELKMENKVTGVDL